MNNYCEQGNCECKFMEDTRRYAIDVPELYKRIDTATDQYSAVVAQNKSLQGELLLSKKMIELMAKRMEVAFAGDINQFIRIFKDKALQELEVENE